MRYRVVVLCVFLVCVSSRVFAYDYCREGQDRTGIVIDQTTVYDTTDRDVIIGGLERILQDISAGSLLTIHTIVDSAANSKIVFSGCRPGCRSQGVGGWFTSGCSAIRAKKEERLYLAGIVGALRPILTRKISYPRSDIVRTIRAVSTKFQGRRLAKLIVYTDLLENSELIPFRKTGYFSDAWAARKRIEELGLLADLSGTDVVVFGFGRSHNNNVFGDVKSGRSGIDAALEKSVIEFWNWYLRASGAKSVEVNRQYSY